MNVATHTHTHTHKHTNTQNSIVLPPLGLSLEWLKSEPAETKLDQHTNTYSHADRQTQMYRSSQFSCWGTSHHWKLWDTHKVSIPRRSVSITQPCNVTSLINKNIINVKSLESASLQKPTINKKLHYTPGRATQKTTSDMHLLLKPSRLFALAFGAIRDMWFPSSEERVRKLVFD